MKNFRASEIRLKKALWHAKKAICYFVKWAGENIPKLLLPDESERK